MNFVTKNLGWILLLLFFLFMLFVISSNDGGTPKVQSGALIESTDTGSTQENLDSLVDMIDTDIDDKNASNEELISNEVVVLEEADSTDKKGFFSFLRRSDDKKENDDSASGSLELDIKDVENDIEEVSDVLEEIDEKIELIEEDVEKELSDIDENIEKEESLFSKIFSRKEKGDDSSVEENVGETQSGVVVVEINENEEVQTSRDELIGLAGKDTTSSSQNVIKISGTNSNVSYTDIQKYAPEVLAQNYPGVNLETEIGKNFEIGVHSLKLNNKYFNQTLGYMMRGDSIKQLTVENSYGCFQIEILASQLSHNVGSKGYVCKKYLQEAGDTVKDDVASETPTIPEVKINVDTNIGDLITIEKSNVMLGDVLLNAGDMVDQFSNGDENGCFMAHVYSSTNSANLGKVGTLCVSNLY